MPQQVEGRLSLFFVTCLILIIFILAFYRSVYAIWPTWRSEEIFSKATRGGESQRFSQNGVSINFFNQNIKFTEFTFIACWRKRRKWRRIKKMNTVWTAYWNDAVPRIEAYRNVSTKWKLTWLRRVKRNERNLLLCFDIRRADRLFILYNCKNVLLIFLIGNLSPANIYWSVGIWVWNLSVYFSYLWLGEEKFLREN